MVEGEEMAVGDEGAPVLTTGAGGPRAPTIGEGGLPRPVLTTPGETTEAGAGATRPGGGNIRPADTERTSRNNLITASIVFTNIISTVCQFFVSKKLFDLTKLGLILINKTFPSLSVFQT